MDPLQSNQRQHIAANTGAAIVARTHLRLRRNYMTLQVSEHPPGNTIAILKIVMLYFLHFSTDQVAHLSLISRVAVCDVALACVYTNAKSFYHRPMGTGPFVKT